MTPSLVHNPELWNRTLATLPRAHVLQTWEWGQFKSRHGWSPGYWLWHDAETPRAAALVLRRRLGRLPFCVMYVPKGPAMDYDDGPLLVQVLADLERIAHRSRAIFIKIDPDLEPWRRIRDLRPGWRESMQQVQFRNTMEIDLRKDEQELLAAMHQKTRYNIRLAQKRGVTVRSGTPGDLELLYAMYDETARRDHFIIRPLEYYRDAWQSFFEAGLAQPLVAEIEGTPMAALILFRFAGRAYYFYGMSRDVHRDKMPNHLLQWEAMQWARVQGCSTYDMWGAPDVIAESDPMWGVYRFKQGFGGQFVQHAGAWDYAVWRPLYWLYAIGMPRVLDLMHKRHWQDKDKPQEAQAPEA